MLLSLLESGFNRFVLIQLLLSLPIIIFALSVHETAHGWVAYKLGDPTAKNLGRLTLNPFKHLNLFGFLSMLIAGIGWANPVPINARNFKNPRVGMALSGIAGPVSNFLMGIVGFTALSGVMTVLIVNEVLYPHVLVKILLLFLYMFASLNLSLGIFNMIPVPPFDGSRFLYIFLPTKWYFKVMKYERYTGIVLLVLLVVLSRIGFSPIGFIVDLVMNLFALPWTLALGITPELFFSVFAFFISF